MNFKRPILYVIFIFFDLLIALIDFNIVNGMIFVFSVIYATVSMSIYILLLLKKISENIILILFLFSFSIFFLVNPVINIIDREDMVLNLADCKAIGVILLAISGIKLGTFLKLMVNSSKNSSTKKFSKNLSYYRRSALFLFLLSLPFFVYNQFQMRQVMINYGYAAIYKSENLDIIFRIGQFTISFYYLFLSCFPPKKEFIKSLLLFIPAISLTVITGERSQIALHSMVLFTYYVIRNSIKGYDFKLNYRIIFSLAIIAIFGSHIFMLISNLRIGDTNNSNISLLHFLKQQSSTFELLSDGIINQGILKNMSNYYSFQAIVNGVTFLRVPLQVFAPSIFNDPFSHNLANAYTFFKDPVYFYLGGRFGSSYLLELFLDGGWFAVLGVNIIIGYLLKVRKLDVFKNHILFYFILISIRFIYFMPRESLFNFLNQFCSLTNLGSVLIILFIGQTLLKIKGVGK